MPPEAPDQVDLNQDLQDQGIHLSPDQQEKYESYLDTLEDAEKQDIIYLTQQELAEFKRILNEDDSAQHDADFDEFIAEQRSEGLNTGDFENLSTSYLLGEGFEKFEGIDELTQQVLFDGEESIFGSLNISPRAQDSMGVALSLAVIEHMSSLDIGEDTDIMAEALQIMWTQLSSLKTLADSQLILGQSSTVPQLNINGMGENNSIFMNPEQGSEFFSKVLSGEIDVQTIENMLEGANQDEAIEGVDISNVPAQVQEHASNLLEKIEAIQNGKNNTGDINTGDIESAINEAEESGEGNTGIMKFLENLLKMFGLEQLFDGVSSNSDDPDGETETDTPETEEIAPTILTAAREMFRTKISDRTVDSSTLAQIQNLFPENGELSETAQGIIRALDGIQDETLEESFNNLFGEREGYETTKFQAFITASKDRFIQEGEPTTSEGLLGIFKEYNTYRAGGTRALYTDYFDSLQSEDTDQN